MTTTHRFTLQLLAAMACLFSLSSHEAVLAQSTAGRWSLGLHGGANLWVNDMNKRKVGIGGDVFLRYGVAPILSLGVQGGYEDLKAYQDPIFVPQLPENYLKLRASHLSFLVWIHLAPGRSVSPYIYAGAGAVAYKRTNTIYHYPENKYYTSIHLPVGVGFESFIKSGLSFTMEASARGLDDKTENYVFKSIDWYGSVKAGLNFYFGSGAMDDDDTDGLSNAAEERLGTDPKNPDTDGDGLKDGEEVRRYKTNPRMADSDGDGLSDGDEVFKYRTDPSQADTDGDGLSDGDEVLKYGTDPLKLDTDGDTLTDGDEVLKYNTDPLKADTDGDGLTDWDEVRSYRTDPTNPDTDGDGLTDFEEIRTYKTDPLRADTDGGGVNDGAEVLRKTDPLNPRDDRPSGAQRSFQMLEEGGKPISLEGVSFISGSSKLLRAAERTLERVYSALVADPTLRIEIAGYTDNVGNPAINRALSLRRAQAVKDWLVRRGIDPSRLIVKGYGMSDPIDTNATPEGRANNRRVEFHVTR